jgi:hypothetical protein
MDILANCELYIGISFHGVITSIGFQKKAIGYNYLGYEKTVQLFKQINLEKYCRESAEDMLPLAEQILAAPLETNLNKLKQTIETHFDTLAAMILDQEKSKCSTLDPIISEQYIDTLVSTAELSQKEKYLEGQLDWYKNDNDDLRKRLQQAFSKEVNV